jgi:anti-sigma factor RsiW
MQCSEAHEALNALIDGENVAGLGAVAAHIAECPHCAARARDYQGFNERLRAVARVPMPPDLADRVRSRLALGTEVANENERFAWPALFRQVATLVLVAGLSGLTSWHLANWTSNSRRLERDVVTAHARALLQDSPVQIASSQSHNVKPWFNGRIEFAPSVKDLTAEGFPLVGGRLDFIGDRRVATLVYKQRMHVINVFVWPASQEESGAPRASALSGYNMISWRSGGMTYWAISDLNAAELAQLQSLL